MKDRKLFPAIGFISLRPVLGKQTAVSKPDSSGSDPSSELANGGIKAPMEY
jgi:hypothetical protein